VISLLSAEIEIGLLSLLRGVAVGDCFSVVSSFVLNRD